MLAINWGNALMITGFGFAMVFSVLVLLIFIVKLFGVIFVQKPKAQPVVAAAQPAAEAGEEDMVAIAYALHLFYNMHDEESDVLTIRHEDATYSPWNQKSITF
ncbi:MAG: OadG family protein [Alistipes sp.]|nr:OadG family protein [Alistipes sp.]